MIASRPQLMSPLLLGTVFLLLQVSSDKSVADEQTTVGQLNLQFTEIVRPFMKAYCLDCHGPEKQEAKLDLSEYSSLATVVRSHETWQTVQERLQAAEMPPEEFDHQPEAAQRQAVIDWIQAVRDHEAARNAGDPGPVLVRRLSNAEYNYSIRDLTGVDIRPTATFPVDPANEAGFDNSGESLAMSPALLRKYLEAARLVVEHLVLKPDGIAFAPHPVVSETDRDKYCVKRIVQFYQNQPTDLADYFFAAWQFRHREQSGRATLSLDDVAAERRISAKYLSTVWNLLTEETEATGPITAIRTTWNNFPMDVNQSAAAREQCVTLRDTIVQLRRKLRPHFDDLYVEGNHKGSQPFVLWKNQQYAAYRQKPDRDKLVVADAADQPTNTADNDLLLPADAADRRRAEAGFLLFCETFPDAFYVSERGRDYVDDSSKQDGERGRLLSAGFHSMMGYFRDDGPLYSLVLDEAGQQQIDALWQELDLITSAPMRQYSGFLWFERTDSRFMRDPEFDFARAEDKAALSEPMIERLADLYLQKAETNGGTAIELQAIVDFFKSINQQIRSVERWRVEAEAGHVAAVQEFAARACRRPLTTAERAELVAFYRSLRDTDGLSHEEAIQDTIVSILMSPYFCYRLDLAAADDELRPLTDIELASRLSYFLWSSMPDEELLDVAAAGQLHEPAVLTQQLYRMLQDDRVNGMAVEFAGNWLDFRRFEEHNSVDRNRFPEFTDMLRQAMFEEPVRFTVDLIQNDRPVTEFLNADYMFVDRTLAKHYGLPDSIFSDAARDAASAVDGWVRVDHANRYGRGGLLPMSVFLTKNSPGLRTSPVKRGYWVVRQLLGERIPPPPPNVPDLPDDESRLGELTLKETLAKHRDHKSCAGCHDRFDSIGLVFENYGPVGERRERDLGDRLVSTSATFPDGTEGSGVGDLRIYLQQHRQHEFVDNLSRKLLSFALGRTLIPSDDLLVREMKLRLTAEDGRFASLLETIVTSPQFLQKRGRHVSAAE